LVEQTTVHFLVPRHQILTQEERKKFFDSTGLKPEQMQKIFSGDQAIKALKPEEGDVVCVFRKNDADPRTEVQNYRLVIK